MTNNPIVYILIILLNSFDGVFTYIMVTAGKVKELNPIMAYLINYNPIVFLLVKLLSVPILIFLLWKYRYKLHWFSTTVMLGMYSVLVMYELILLF